MLSFIEKTEESICYCSWQDMVAGIRECSLHLHIARVTLTIPIENRNTYNFVAWY